MDKLHFLGIEPLKGKRFSTSGYSLSPVFNISWVVTRAALALLEAPQPASSLFLFHELTRLWGYCPPLKAGDRPSLWAKRLRICLSLHFLCWEWFSVPLGSKGLRLIFGYWWGRIGRQTWPESSLSFLTSALWFEAKYPANNKVLFCLVVSLFPVHVSPPGTSQEGKMAGQDRI